MTYGPLIIFVEGPNDKRFFERIIKPLLEKKLPKREVHPMTYKNRKKEVINEMIKVLKGSKEKYLFVVDGDENYLDISACKKKVCSIYTNLDPNSVIVVAKKIEGWYVAGIDPKKINCQKKPKCFNENTNHLGKFRFEELQNEFGFNSETDFRIEILNSYDLKIARKRNTSLDYFCNTYID